MQQWEYLELYSNLLAREPWCVDSAGRSWRPKDLKPDGWKGIWRTIAPVMDELGAEGWELVCQSQDRLLFKRPKQ